MNTNSKAVEFSDELDIVITPIELSRRGMAPTSGASNVTPSTPHTCYTTRSSIVL